jgi:hypothetical protein
MDFTYTWAVTSLTTATISDLPNVVLNVKWTLTGTEADGDFGVFNGATPLTTNDITSETFVPFNELTEELILSWIKPVVFDNAAYKQHIDQQINKQILGKKESLDSNKPLPWLPIEPITAVLPPTN